MAIIEDVRAFLPYVPLIAYGGVVACALLAAWLSHA